MYDIIEKIGKSQIQHGKNNDRIYLMKIHENDADSIIEKVENKASENDYSKIFAKIPERFVEKFINNGYSIEAWVKKFYYGNENGYFLAKYLKADRKELASADKEEIDKILSTANAKALPEFDYNLPDGFSMRPLDRVDADSLAALYKIVFESYPFPIHNPEFILETMDSNVEYFGVFNSDNELIAASSAEKYTEYGNVEMTDFATNPDYLGHGFAIGLLKLMEKEMKKQRMTNLYTIARSHSFGMNITFSKNGYLFAGTLINNTDIFGRIESMNVWYKNI